MDQNDANQNCHNTREAQKEGEGLRQEPSSNNDSVEISDKTDSKTTAEEGTFASHILQSGDFQKDTEALEAVRRVMDSFSHFQILNVDNGENDKLHTDASYNHTSAIGRSLCAPSNISANVSKQRVRRIIENSYKDANDIRIISTRISSSTESSTSACITDIKREISPFSNYRVKINFAVLKEDDDWDIYQPGMDYGTSESLIESRLSFENGISQNERHVSKINAPNFVASDSRRQRPTPYAGRKANHSQSSNLTNIGGTFPEWNEERMLEEVKLFFLFNPPLLIFPHTELEFMTLVITSPYFSWDFALKHGLSLPPPVTPQQLILTSDNIPKDPFLKGCVLLKNAGITRRHFTTFMSMWLHMPPDETVIEEVCKEIGLDPFTMQHLNMILEIVGPPVLIRIYEKLTIGDPEISLIFRDEESSPTNEVSKSFEELDVNGIDRSVFLTDDSNDLLINADFPSTSSQTHVNSASSRNAPDSNSFSDTNGLKAEHKMLKTSQSPMDLSEMQSLESSDISETDSKKCPSILQSSNRDEENRSPLDSLHGDSNKTNESPDRTPITPPQVRNSLDQNESLKSRDSKNNAPHSPFQNSEEEQSEKLEKVLADILNERSRVRKHNIKDDSKSRKRIRLQENSNTAQPENKENTPIKDESETPPKDYWPAPITKPCIIM